MRLSTIPDANYGLFAARNFRKGDIIGIYNGGKALTGHPGHSIVWQHGIKHCYPFNNSRSMNENHCKTMGMQMINDPEWNKVGEEKESAFKVNVFVDKCLLVRAKIDIVKGDELFMNYQLNGIKNTEEMSGFKKNRDDKTESVDSDSAKKEDCDNGKKMD